MEIKRNLANGGYIRVDKNEVSEDAHTKAIADVLKEIAKINPADVSGLVVGIRMKEEVETFDIVAFGGYMNFIQEALAMILSKMLMTLDTMYGKEGMIAEHDAKASFDKLLTTLRGKS